MIYLRRALFYENEQVTSTDLMIDSTAVIDNVHEAVVAMYGTSDGLIHRGAITANTPTGGITLTSLVVLVGGKLININSPQTINILADNGTWGTSQAPHATNSRYTIVSIKYTTTDTVTQFRYFRDPDTGATTSQEKDTARETSYDIVVTHGVGTTGDPVVPDTPPDYVKLLTIFIPPVVTAVNSAYITYDIDTQLISVGDTTKLMRSKDYIGNSYVRTGLIGSRNGTNSNILDVTAGTAIIAQTDGNYKTIDKAAQSFVARTANTTYYLDLNPNGSFSWGTAHSVTPGYLAICSATTDTGVALTVTNVRVLTNGLNAETLDGNGISSAATANKIILRDAAGRAKVAAPSAADDIARKDTIDTHAALTNAHSAASAATASRIVLRDASGRAKVADPSAADDIATKGTVDTHAALTNAHSAASAATPNVIMMRDGSGRAKVVDPSAADDIATKGTVDTHAALTNAHGGPIMNVGGITNPGGGVDIIAGTGIVVAKSAETKRITISSSGPSLPANHASTHFSGGSDEIDPEDIGAVDASYIDTQISTHNSNTSAHQATTTATANRIVLRDASGRAKVAAPSAADDIARKDTVDAVTTQLNSHIGQGGVVHAAATTTVAGFMSAADKTKLDGIDEGAKSDHTQLTNIGVNTHAQIDTHIAATAPHTGHVSHSLATASNDFLVASGSGAFVKKTLAETKSILSLGTAASHAEGDFAPFTHVGSRGISQHNVATASVAGFMSTTDFTKLSNIEESATADMTPAEIRTALSAYYGHGNLLDTDMLDGVHAIDFQSRVKLYGYVELVNYQIPELTTVNYDISLGAGPYNKGIVVLRCNDEDDYPSGILIHVGETGVDSFVIGTYYNGSSYGGSAWSKRDVGAITTLDRYGHRASGDPEVTITNCFITGAEGNTLRIIFYNSSSTFIGFVNANIDWEVW